MELLKEVARDRLVVMVTHNPELAEAYATRIVHLKDGRIRSDSHPFQPDSGPLEEPVHKKMGKASMSFLTALSLSFNNLRTKKARTLLTSFAGSIGIIGIALILSLSNGVNAYIKSVEEDTLSEYPVELQSTEMDFASMMAGMGSTTEAEGDGQVTILELITNMFSTVDATTWLPSKPIWTAEKAASNPTPAPMNMSTAWRRRSTGPVRTAASARSIRTNPSPPWASAPPPVPAA